MIKWISWGTHHLTNAASVLYWHRIIVPTFSDEVAEPQVLENALNDFRRFAAILDTHLGGKTWLVGDRISYADFRVATSLPFAAGAGLPVDEFPQVRRWNEQLLAIDAWRAPFAGLT